MRYQVKVNWFRSRPFSRFENVPAITDSRETVPFKLLYLFRHDVPAISSRNLHDLRLAEFSFSKQSLVRIDVKYRDYFLVNYVYGFNSSQHVYFATVQKKSYLPGKEGGIYQLIVHVRFVSVLRFPELHKFAFFLLLPNLNSKALKKIQ
jgi:hypothetical protein